jgi:uncharacterized integral membrane protein
MPGRDEAEGPSRRRGITLGAREVVALLVIVLAGVFIFQNTRRVRIDVLWADFEVRVWLALLAAFLLGAAVGVLATRVSRRL